NLRLRRKRRNDQPRFPCDAARTPASPEPDLRHEVINKRNALAMEVRGQKMIEMLTVDEHREVGAFVLEHLAKLPVRFTDGPRKTQRFLEADVAQLRRLQPHIHPRVPHVPAAAAVKLDTAILLKDVPRQMGRLPVAGNLAA